MIVKSPKKKSGNINVKLPNKDENSEIRTFIIWRRVFYWELNHS